MTIKEWAVLHKKELLASGATLFICFLFYGIFIYLPKPDLKNPPTSTKEATVTIQGTATNKVGVAIFDTAGNALMIVTSNEKGDFTFTGVPVGEGKTEFAIRALASSWRVSFPRKLVIEKDTTAPALSIHDLKGATVTGSSTIVSGKAEPGSTVTVNGVKTTVDENGNWTATVALNPGSNTVTVSATDAAGNVYTESQTIQYQPSATGSPTGTASVSTSTTSVSSGSSLPGTTDVPSSDTSDPAQLSLPPTSPSTNQTPTPTPQQTILGIVANAWVSNAAPNERANQTINASVKDNYGRPVTNASVIARVYFKSGMTTYSLTHTANGNYTTSFKLNDKFVDGYRVNTEIIATLNTLTAVANTSFTPKSTR